MSEKQRHSRRTFLAQAASAIALAGCAPSEPTPSQALKARKLQGTSKVAIVRAKSYQDNLFQLLKPHIEALELPNLSGKHVVLKPNLVDIRKGLPTTTNAMMVACAFDLVTHLGAARVTVADGPALYRDTQYILDASGIGEICRKLKVEFVDLNLDDLATVENPDGFTPLKQFYLPKTIVESDCVVSLPKLKTHHWAGMTCSIKNCFGCVPGRKYGWPKNILHGMGLDKSIMDVVSLVRPGFALVDAVIAMEGEGPLNGSALETGFMVLGKDLAAVDATCARTMGLDVNRMLYLRLAGQVVGNIEPQNIQQVADSIESVEKKFKLPETWQDGHTPGSSLAGGT